MERLILIRHGETSKNSNGKMHDSFDPEELNETGIVQIQKTAKAITNHKPDIIYCSKEKRAVQSATIIGQLLGIEYIETDGLHERNWGILSGKPWPEIQAILDPMSLEERYSYTPPAGESWQIFENRLNTAIDKILDDNPNKTIIVVTHGGFIRVLMPHLLHTSKEESLKYVPDNASVTIFDRNNGIFSQIVINDTTHLQ